jgi:hypothetical protein
MRASKASRAVAALAVLGTGIAVACADEDRASGPLWTVRQARSISTIRGMHVRVHECRGLGHAERDDRSSRSRRFACIAGARRPGETFDTVGVLYDLRPLGRYEGPASKRALENVRFIGGPGIP